MIALANALGVDADCLSVFPAATVGDALDVYIGVHTSPYEVPGRIVDTMISESDVYNTALRGNDSTSQVELAPTVFGNPGALVLQCLTEAAAASACDCRGCRSQLATVGTPAVGAIPAGWNAPRPGDSTVGPFLKTSIDCWCNGGDPQPPTQEPITCLDPNACFNGGFCR